MNMSAALLVVWYCMSIIGFDVHTCMSSGRTFIAAFTETLACADIHPESHSCGESCCNEHHDTPSFCCSESREDTASLNRGLESIGTRSCCSNEYQVIQLSGCRTTGESDDKYSFSKVLCPCIVDLPVRYIALAKYSAKNIEVLEPDSGLIMPDDVCVVFGVWRI